MVKFQDIILSSILLVIFLIPMLLVALYLSFIFGKGLIFKDIRVGLFGKKIIIFKFKTMYDVRILDPINANGPDINRIIKFGATIRKHRLDELPQLLNVLKGDISLVGPRPERVDLAERYSDLIPNYNSRHLVKPGLTGLAQVRQGHVTNEAKTRKKLALDLIYIKNKSLCLDIFILLQTAKTVITGKGGK